MDDKQRMQADGGQSGGQGGGDATGAGREGGGDSAGGAYPNPHSGKSEDQSNFMGHGGQTEIAHHGGDQLGEEKVGDADDNSATQ